MLKKISKIKINFKLIGGVLYDIILFLLIVIAAGVGVSALNIPGGIKLFTVESGSMSPKIPTGSIVISKPSNTYQKGDMITFKSAADSGNNNPKYTTTHRIYEVKSTKGKEEYVTKGDANNAPDITPTGKDLVLGKAVFSIPLIGYPIAFAKTRDGLIILVIIPATIIIYSELMNIKNEAKKLIKERKKKLSKKEKLELEIGEEEIKAERWYRNLYKKIFHKSKK